MSAVQATQPLIAQILQVANMAQLDAPERERLVCGMALGYADESDPVNRYRPDRRSPQEYVV